MKWGAVIPAGGLVEEPLAAAIGTPRKALARVAGRTCLARTLDAVRDAQIEDCVTVSGEDVVPEVHHGKWVPEGSGHMDNVRLGVEALDPVDAVLFLPADTPLLSAESIRHFVDAVERRLAAEEDAPPWYAVGICPLEAFLRDFPNIATYPLRFRDGPILSGAFYATTPAGFHLGYSAFEKVSESRKDQVGLLLKLGPWNLLRFLTHRLGLEDARKRVEKVLGGRAIVIADCDPVSMADIDEVSDYERLCELAEARGM